MPGHRKNTKIIQTGAPAGSKQCAVPSNLMIKFNGRFLATSKKRLRSFNQR